MPKKTISALRKNNDLPEEKENEIRRILQERGGVQDAALIKRALLGAKNVLADFKESEGWTSTKESSTEARADLMRGSSLVQELLDLVAAIEEKKPRARGSLHTAICRVFCTDSEDDDQIRRNYDGFVGAVNILPKIKQVFEGAAGEQSTQRGPKMLVNRRFFLLAVAMIWWRATGKKPGHILDGNKNFTAFGEFAAALFSSIEPKGKNEPVWNMKLSEAWRKGMKNWKGILSEAHDLKGFQEDSKFEQLPYRIVGLLNDFAGTIRPHRKTE
jgi:hypothetical protein